eukprot:2498574-Rhodomonas_salina.1
MVFLAIAFQQHCSGAVFIYKYSSHSRSVVLSALAHNCTSSMLACPPMFAARNCIAAPDPGSLAVPSMELAVVTSTPSKCTAAASSPHSSTSSMLANAGPVSAALPPPASEFTVKRGQRDHCRERGPIRGRPAADSPEVLPCRSIVALYRPAPRTARQPPAAAEHFVLLQRKLQRMLDRHLCFGSECCVVGSIEVVHSIARVSDVPHTHKVCSPRQGSRRLGPEASVIPIECPQIALTVGSCGGVVVYVAHQSFVQPPTAVHSTCVRLVHLRVTFDLSSQQQPNHVVLSFVRLRCTHPRTTIQIWFPRDGIIYTVHCRKESASLDLVKHLGSAQSEPRDKVFAPRPYATSSEVASNPLALRTGYFWDENVKATCTHVPVVRAGPRTVLPALAGQHVAFPLLTIIADWALSCHA